MFRLKTSVLPNIATIHKVGTVSLSDRFRIRLAELMLQVSVPSQKVNKHILYKSGTQ